MLFKLKNKKEKLFDLASNIQSLDNSRLDIVNEHGNLKKSLDYQAKEASKMNNQQMFDKIYERYNLYLTKEFIPRAGEIKKGLEVHFEKQKRLLFGKKTCVAGIVMNMHGQILLLRRAKHDEFHPGTWCLPGGGMDNGENPYGAIVRESIEEINLNLPNYKLCDLVELEDVNIYYFEVMIKHETRVITLDNNEHDNYIWADFDTWKNLPLILDLKEHLCKILGHEFTPSLFQGYLEVINNALQPEQSEVRENFDVIEKGFTAGIISEDIYNQVKELEMVKGGYPVGTERSYSDGSTWKKVADTGGKGDWVLHMKDYVKKEIIENQNHTEESDDGPVGVEKNDWTEQQANNYAEGRHSDDNGEEEGEVTEEAEEVPAAVEEVPVIEDDYMPKIYDRPDMESPVYRVVVGGEERYIQRQDGMNPGDTAWYEVKKEPHPVKEDVVMWETVGNSKSYSHFANNIGYTKKEAVEGLIRKYTQENE